MHGFCSSLDPSIVVANKLPFWSQQKILLMHQPASHQFLLSICHKLSSNAMHGAVTVDTFKQFHCHNLINIATLHCYNFSMGSYILYTCRWRPWRWLVARRHRCLLLLRRWIVRWRSSSHHSISLSRSAELSIFCSLSVTVRSSWEWFEMETAPIFICLIGAMWYYAHVYTLYIK